MLLRKNTTFCVSIYSIHKQLENMPDLTKKKKNTTVLGKTPKKKTTLSKLVNSPLSPDYSGDRNVSAGELVAEAGLTAIGGKLAASALSKIGRKSVGKVGKLVANFANKMFPSSGKNIVKAKKKYALDDFDVGPDSSDTQREMVNILHKIDKSYSPPKTKKIINGNN